MSGAAYAPKTNEMCDTENGASVYIKAEYKNEEVSMVQKATNKTPAQVTETFKQTRTQAVKVSLNLVVLLAALVPKGYLSYQ